MATEAPGVTNPSSSVPSIVPRRRVGNQHSAPVPVIIERAGGFQCILDLIRSGQSHREISQSLGIGHASLCRYLSDGSRAQEAQRAMADSAESWLDRGMLALEHAAGKDIAEVQRARAIAQECARRAAIRNPRYSDRAQVELSGSVGEAATTIIYLPDNGRQRLGVSDGNSE